MESETEKRQLDVLSQYCYSTVFAVSNVNIIVEKLVPGMTKHRTVH